MSRLSNRLALFALIGALFLVVAPARAQLAGPKVGGTASGENLSNQQREMLALAIEFGRQSSAILEKWIANKEITEEKLFSRLYYPIPKSDPPMFSTDYDKLADRDIQPLDEQFLARSGALVYVNIYDLNCYNPTHNLKFAAPPTGNPAVDLMNSRQKWITQNHTAQLSVRNTAPFLIQTYQRDTGEILEELAVPLFVRGQHWGAVRIAFRKVVDVPGAAAAER
jgi:methyl-accepting chemotaxis protein